MEDARGGGSLWPSVRPCRGTQGPAELGQRRDSRAFGVVHGRRCEPTGLAATLGPNGLSDHPTITFWFEVLGMVPRRVDSAVECLSRIEDYRPAIEAARDAGFKGKGSYPKILLDELVASAEDTATLFDAIEIIADPVGATQVG